METIFQTPIHHLPDELKYCQSFPPIQVVETEFYREADHFVLAKTQRILE